MKKLIPTFILFAFSSILSAQQIVNFKDQSLKLLIKNDLNIDRDTIFDTDMQKLTSFIHHYEKIKDLSGMEYATNLDKLDLSRNWWGEKISLKGLSSLSNLSHLRYLNLCCNNLTDISDLSSLKNLDSLSLEFNKIDKLTAISGLTSLRFLNLNNNNIGKEDFPDLYNLKNLRPVLYLLHNGPGFSYQEIASLARHLPKIPMNRDSIRWNLLRTEIGINQYLRIRAAYIDTLSENIYKLSGDVYLQYLASYKYDTWVDNLYFPEGAKLDKTGEFPVISGSGNVYAWGKLLSTGGFDFTLELTTLKVKTPGEDMLDGFHLLTGEVHLSKDIIEQKFEINNMPFPLDKIFKYLNDKNKDETNEYVNFFIWGTKSFTRNSTSYAFRFFSYGTYSFGAFSIKEPNIFYDGTQKKMGGSFKVRIPGSDYDNLSSTKKTATLPVLITDSAGNIKNKTTLEKLVKNTKGRWWGNNFIELGMDIEFLNNNIDKLILSLSSDIPIGTSGLKITSISGGVKNVSSEMKIDAKVDIASSVEVPGFGPVVEVTDFGVTIAPLYSLTGTGNFKMFGHQCANGYLKYNARLNALSLHGDVNLGGILIGNVKSTLNGSSFTGVLNASLKTPHNLPWKLKFLSDKKLAAVTATINNNVISSTMYYHDFSIAQRMIFGKSEFPYFKYYLGTNLDNLHQVFKSGKIQFDVPQNTSKMLVVVGNDQNLFDFSVISPDGIEYSKTNTIYDQYPDALQSTMIIKAPKQGTWTLKTAQQGDIKLNVLKENSPPLGRFTEPAVRKSPTNKICYEVKDLQDTVIVKFYYDNDNKGYDGIQFYWGEYPQQYVVHEQKKIETFFSNNFWHFIGDLPDGEYFIYASIDDGKNPTIYQYAPGSFYLSWGEFYTTPKKLKTEIVNDSIKVSWERITDSTVFMTHVFYQAFNSDVIHEKYIYDTNFVFLTNIEKGVKYNIWANLMNYKNFEGPFSDTLSIFLKDELHNNPPQFTMEINTSLAFTVGNKIEYLLNAFDADNDSLFFALPDDSLGIEIAGNRLIWTPRQNQQGVYRVLLTVTDKKSTDSIYLNLVVYEKNHFKIAVNFPENTLYNDRKVAINVQNALLGNQSLPVILRNLRTDEEDTLVCLKISDINYRGFFYLNNRASTSDIEVQSSDTLVVFYQYHDSLYSDTAVYEPKVDLAVPHSFVLSGLHVYPTVSNGRFTIELIQPKPEKITIEIYNTQGKLVVCQENNFFSSQKYNLSFLPAGMYYVKVITRKGIGTRKIIIKK